MSQCPATPTAVDESDGMLRRVRAAASYFFFLAAAAQARRLSLSGAFGWAEGALKCHARNSDGGVAIEVLIERIFCVFGRSLGSRAVWAIVLVSELGLRPP